MTDNDKFLSKLLPLDAICNLFFGINGNIHTIIDLRNLDYGFDSINNTMTLLRKCGFVFAVDDNLIRLNRIEDRDSFIKEFRRVLKICFRHDIDTILNIEKKYDEELDRFYIERNLVSYDYSGLLMIMDQLEMIKLTDFRIYIKDEKIINQREVVNKTQHEKRRFITAIEDLEKGLIIKKELGREAERKALEFEKKLLKAQSILYEPKLISDIDVSAGYDMVSYMSDKSSKADKFIEIKNCDKNYNFYFSKNEYKVAQIKGESYFLYLYNRDKDEFFIVRNPVERIFESGDWGIETQIYGIHKL